MLTKVQAFWKALTGSTWAATLGSIVSIAASIGLLSVEQSTLILNIITGVGGLIGLVGSLFATFKHAAALQTLHNARSVSPTRYDDVG